MIHLFVVSKDMEEYANRQLRENAYLDSLTGLLNRRAYERDFSETLDKRADSNLVFGSLDMNGLKTINDTVGHEAGDEMIIGAAECMQQALGSYGNIYRTGGDEFNAIIFATPDQLIKIKSDLEDCIEGWTGDLADNISVAFGFVHINEIENPTMKALSLEADKRMYNEKRKYYTRNGVDRRSLRDAHVALCHLYTKILKVNLTEDSYVIVDVDESEVAADKGFSESISEWLSSFGTTGMVHPDDLEDYLGKTNIEYLRNYFRNGNKIIRINYRRKVSGTYKHVTMEMIPANDYTDNNQSLYLYVKTMED